MKDVKEHVTNLHEGGNIYFEQIKCYRNYSDYFYKKNAQSEGVFEKKKITSWG